MRLIGRVIHRDNDILFKTMGQTRYMTWWMIADKFPELIKMVENMARLISKAPALSLMTAD